MADWSKRLLPMLTAMVASVTLPLAASTVTTQTPWPVMCLARASYGYGGCGFEIAHALAVGMFIRPCGGCGFEIANALAFDMFIVPGADGALIGAAFVCGRF